MCVKNVEAKHHTNFLWVWKFRTKLCHHKFWHPWHQTNELIWLHLELHSTRLQISERKIEKVEIQFWHTSNKRLVPPPISICVLNFNFLNFFVVQYIFYVSIHSFIDSAQTCSLSNLIESSKHSFCCHGERERQERVTCLELTFLLWCFQKLS